MLVQVIGLFSQLIVVCLIRRALFMYRYVVFILGLAILAFCCVPSGYVDCNTVFILLGLVGVAGTISETQNKHANKDKKE